MNPALFVATLGGIGRLKPAPGTWGSLVVLPLLVFGPVIALLLGLLVTLLGFVATREVLRDAPDEDPGWIVVDEAAGMLIALLRLCKKRWVKVFQSYFRLPDKEWQNAMPEYFATQIYQSLLRQS